MTAYLLQISILFAFSVWYTDACIPADVCFNVYYGEDVNTYGSAQYTCETDTIKCVKSYTTKDCMGDAAEENCYDYSTPTNATITDNIVCTGCTDYLMARIYRVNDDDDVDCSTKSSYQEVIQSIGCVDLVYGSTSYECTADSVTTGVFLGKTDDGACEYDDQFLDATQENGCNFLNISNVVTRTYLEVLYCGSDSSDTNGDDPTEQSSDYIGFNNNVVGVLLFMMTIVLLMEL